MELPRKQCHGNPQALTGADRRRTTPSFRLLDGYSDRCSQGLVRSCLVILDFRRVVNVQLWVVYDVQSITPVWRSILGEPWRSHVQTQCKQYPCTASDEALRADITARSRVCAPWHCIGPDTTTTTHYPKLPNTEPRRKLSKCPRNRDHLTDKATTSRSNGSPNKP